MFLNSEAPKPWYTPLMPCFAKQQEVCDSMQMMLGCCSIQLIVRRRNMIICLLGTLLDQCKIIFRSPKSNRVCVVTGEKCEASTAANLNLIHTLQQTASIEQSQCLAECLTCDAYTCLAQSKTPLYLPLPTWHSHVHDRHAFMYTHVTSDHQLRTRDCLQESV